MSADEKKGRLSNTLYYYAEITIKALSPLVLASGKGGSLFDVELVRDANGLPAIPGSTIAGVLRHAVQTEKGKDFEKELFGYQNENNGKTSAVEVSWAYVHDSNNQIHKYFYAEDDIKNDAILKELYITDNPEFKRDHVHVSEKGTSVNNNKFDRYFTPTGTRFTFSIGMWSDKNNNDGETVWKEILKTLFSPSFRIGSASHDGYGRIKVIEIKIPANEKYCFDINEDMSSFKNCKGKYSLEQGGEEQYKIIKLNFPLGFRIGGSILYSDDEESINIKPYREKVIVWNADENNNVAFKERITIPGSSIKGVLRHRTAFHLARINGNWIKNPPVEEYDDGLSELFGYAANEKKGEKGLVGKIWFTDLYLENDISTYQFSRNSIDRFTGGTLERALFTEENVMGTFTASYYYDKSLNDNKKLTNALKAFEWAVSDLEKGRLAIGGGSGHGLGFSCQSNSKASDLK